jgi:hypothetical protein
MGHASHGVDCRMGYRARVGHHAAVRACAEAEAVPPACCARLRSDCDRCYKGMERCMEVVVGRDQSSKVSRAMRELRLMVA